MLQKLFISNFALIEQLEIQLGPGLQIITGETGAGKSIILGALQLATGARADVSNQHRNDTKCVVEAQFQIEGLDLRAFFKHHDLDYAPETLLRREILPGGRSRAFVNDSPVPLQLLKSLGEQLLHIHLQHDTLLLKEPGFQQNMFDIVSGADPLFQTYHKAWNELKILERQKEQLLAEKREAEKTADFLQFQVNSWKSLGWRSGLFNELEMELKSLEHADLIRQTLLDVGLGLQSNQEGVLSKLHQWQSALQKIAPLHPNFETQSLRINSVRLELQDLAMEMEQQGQKTFSDPERLQEIRDKLSGFYEFQRKHAVATESEAMDLVSSWESALVQQANQDELLEKLQKEYTLKKESLLALANQLSVHRKKYQKAFKEELENHLRPLGLPEARLETELNLLEEPGPYGLEKPQLLFSANARLLPGPLGQTASGGELSRVMLALKSLAAKRRQMPTLIFDEIDTGVSGKVASAMGRLLAALGEGMQVLAITHLPQIAASGNRHFKVSKNQGKTTMQELDPENRVLELAGMLSGEKITQEAREQALKLLQSA